MYFFIHQEYVALLFLASHSYPETKFRITKSLDIQHCSQNNWTYLRVKAKEDSTDKESDDDQAGNPTKKLLGILLTLSSVSFFATGFTMVGLVIKRGV
eukprot:Seg1376.9 transcript_id=Seg1376.9/GoldUCD/mRNA.D3Y31 product="hypothetical protein" protein_id=Seg1376.9/GoldUCD/D3Y31